MIMATDDKNRDAPAGNQLSEAKAAELSRHLQEALEALEAASVANHKLVAEILERISALIEQRAALHADRMKRTAAAAAAKRREGPLRRRERMTA